MKFKILVLLFLFCGTSYADDKPIMTNTFERDLVNLSRASSLMMDKNEIDSYYYNSLAEMLEVLDDQNKKIKNTFLFELNIIFYSSDGAVDDKITGSDLKRFTKNLNGTVDYLREKIEEDKKLKFKTKIRDLLKKYKNRIE